MRPRINAYQRPETKVPLPLTDAVYDLPGSLRKTGCWWTESYSGTNERGGEEAYDRFLE